MRHHKCVIENRNAFKQHAFAMKNVVDALSKNEMPDHDRERMEAALEQGHARAKQLIGLYLGMLLQWQPDSDSANKMVEDYLGDGGRYSSIEDGMKAMARELKRERQEAQPEASAQQGENEWFALSDAPDNGGSSAGNDSQHRSRHENSLRRNHGLDLNERIFPLANKV